ncbi:MAG: tyrosine-type recombinase/integrase [Rhodospirillales bacterium]
MAKRALSEAKILEANPASNERQELPDGLVDGLYLRVGRKRKSWIYRYRNKAGKQRRMTIGHYASPEDKHPDPTKLNNQQLDELTQRGRLSLAEAREVARFYARQVAQNKDPQGELIEAKQNDRERVPQSSGVVVTVEQGLIRYIEGHIKVHSKPRRYRKDGTPVFQREDDAKRWIIPNIGYERIEDLTQKRVKSFHTKITKNHGARAADIAVEILRASMNYLRDEGIRDDALAIRMKKSKAEKQKSIRKRYLEDNEIKIFWKSCDAVDHIYSKFAKLLFLTGQRLREVAGMRWDDLQEDGKRWLIKDTKNSGNMLVPLSRQAQELLETITPIGDYVFKVRSDKPLTSFTTCKQSVSDAIIKKHGADLVDWRFHDLRRTFRTNLSRLRVPFEVREACLNHTKSEMAEIYDQWDFYDEKAEAFQKWADLVNQIVNDKLDINLIISGKPKENIEKSVHTVENEPKKSNVVSIQSRI